MGHSESNMWLDPSSLDEHHKQTYTKLRTGWLACLMGFMVVQFISILCLLFWFWIIFILLQFVAIVFMFGSAFCRIKMRRIVLTQLLHNRPHQTVIIQAAPSPYANPSPYGTPQQQPYTQAPYQPYGQPAPYGSQPAPPTQVNLAKEVLIVQYIPF